MCKEKMDHFLKKRGRAERYLKKKWNFFKEQSLKKQWKIGFSDKSAKSLLVNISW